MSIKNRGRELARTLTDAQKAAKRAELVQVAIKILEMEGLQALTLRRLAAEAGISRSTPYLYFQDKSELMEAICAETFRYLISKCERVMEDYAGYLDQMMAMGRYYLDFGIERPTLYHLIFAPKSPEDEVSPEVQAVLDDYTALSEIPMRQAYEDGIVKYPPERLNPVLWASLHGLLCLCWAGHLSEEGLFNQVREDMEQILGLGFMDKDRVNELIEQSQKQ